MKKILVLIIFTILLQSPSYAYVNNYSGADNLHMYPAGVSTYFRTYNNSSNKNITYRVGNSTINTTLPAQNIIRTSTYRPGNFAYQKIYENRTLWYDANGNRIGSVVNYSDGRSVIYDANGRIKNTVYSDYE